jgi:hypothetical protein
MTAVLGLLAILLGVRQMRRGWLMRDAGCGVFLAGALVVLLGALLALVGVLKGFA